MKNGLSRKSGFSRISAGGYARRRPSGFSRSAHFIKTESVRGSSGPLFGGAQSPLLDISGMRFPSGFSSVSHRKRPAAPDIKEKNFYGTAPVEWSMQKGPVVEKSLGDLQKLAEHINSVSMKRNISTEHLLLEKMAVKYSAILGIGATGKNIHDRRGYSLAECLAEQASMEGKNSRERNVLISDMEKVLRSGGSYSPNSRLFDSLLEKDCGDILMAFDRNARKELFGNIYAEGGKTAVADAVKTMEREQREERITELKEKIVSKYLDGNIRGAEDDLREMAGISSKSDRIETLQAASAALWIEGTEKRKPEVLVLAASLCQTMDKEEKTRMADLLVEWFKSLDGDKRRMALDSGMDEIFESAGIQHGFERPADVMSTEMAR